MGFLKYFLIFLTLVISSLVIANPIELTRRYLLKTDQSGPNACPFYKIQEIRHARLRFTSRIPASIKAGKTLIQARVFSYQNLDDGDYEQYMYCIRIFLIDQHNKVTEYFSPNGTDSVNVFPVCDKEGWIEVPKTNICPE